MNPETLGGKVLWLSGTGLAAAAWTRAWMPGQGRSGIEG